MAEIPGSLFVPIEDQSHSPFATEGESGHPLGLRSASGPCFPASAEVQPFVARATKGYRRQGVAREWFGCTGTRFLCLDPPGFWLAADSRSV